MPHRSWRAATSLIFLLATATACVSEVQRPTDCGATQVQRQSTLAANRLDPSSIGACRGQRLTIDTAAEQDGVLHLHGYEEEAPATEVRNGDTARWTFVAVHGGQFVIELHTLDGSALEVGILTIHEP